MEGWTGKDCPNCEGRGIVRDDFGYEVPCDVCGGTGHEWGEIPDDSDGWSPLTAKREAARGTEQPLNLNLGMTDNSELSANDRAPGIDPRQ
jgi:DnaJ-class molecular chaperone